MKSRSKYNIPKSITKALRQKKIKIDSQTIQIYKIMTKLYNKKLKQEIEYLENLIIIKNNKIELLKEIKRESLSKCHICENTKTLRYFNHIALCNNCITKADEEYWKNGGRLKL